MKKKQWHIYIIKNIKLCYYNKTVRKNLIGEEMDNKEIRERIENLADDKYKK